MAYEPIRDSWSADDVARMRIACIETGCFTVKIYPTADVAAERHDDCLTAEERVRQLNKIPVLQGFGVNYKFVKAD